MSTSDRVNGSRTHQQPEVIRAEIAQTRAELAATVDALHVRLDVRRRARTRAAEVRQGVLDRTTTPTGMPRPELLAAAVASVALLALLAWRRRS